MSSDGRDANPMIGSDISWKAVRDEAFLIRSFTPYATVDAEGQVSAPPVPFRYGQLDVESLLGNRRLAMPVNHRLDFLNLGDLYSTKTLPDGSDLFVCYMPYRGFLGPLLRLGSPVLHLLLLDDETQKDFLMRPPEDPKARHKGNRILFATPDRCFDCGAKLWSLMTRCTTCNTPLY